MVVPFPAISAALVRSLQLKCKFFAFARISDPEQNIMFHRRDMERRGWQVEQIFVPQTAERIPVSTE